MKTTSVCTGYTMFACVHLVYVHLDLHYVERLFIFDKYYFLNTGGGLPTVSICAHL